MMQVYIRLGVGGQVNKIKDGGHDSCLSSLGVWNSPLSKEPFVIRHGNGYPTSAGNPVHSAASRTVRSTCERPAGSTMGSDQDMGPCQTVRRVCECRHCGVLHLEDEEGKSE